ncbi:MAG: hypothetical protein RLY16_300 [Bacteroidota bacterium]|jgi:hypothetical protein
MKYTLVLFFLFFAQLHVAQAQTPKRDTVYTGIYVNSIHDIDFKQKEYAINCWLWLHYKNKELNFLENLEIPQAKTFSKSFSTIDTSNGEVRVMMKLQCVMKDSWKINNFPFDQQRLRLSIENSQFDEKAMVFVADTAGKQYDTRFTLNGWKIDSFLVSTGVRKYETAFGDPAALKPESSYSNFKVKIVIKRDAMGIFWKMFLGMYISALIAYLCFYIHADSVDSRFGLTVGALFAVIGNKYIIDSSLPETSSFTLVDTLHGLTLAFILLVIACTTMALQIMKNKSVEKANKFDRWAGQILLALYIGLNCFFIAQAV